MQGSLLNGLVEFKVDIKESKLNYIIVYCEFEDFFLELNFNYGN